LVTSKAAVVPRIAAAPLASAARFATTFQLAFAALQKA
jgi:hypothetical protein